MAVLYANISVLNLMRAATISQCREMGHGCDMGPFGFAEDQSCHCILNHL